MQFPIISVIVFIPIITGMLILLFPSERKTEIRVTALAASAVALGLSTWLYFSYDVDTAGYQFVEKVYLAKGIGHFLLCRRRRHEHAVGLADWHCDVHRCVNLMGG